ncbi:MAG TPA: hypothetical protein VJ901_08460, partial [Thermoanaerobaculia bacterium]|nr:hypothetical protein [Thermoanaerobaculia bacterium]
GVGAQVLIVSGVNFLTGSQVAVNGAAHSTTFVNANELNVTLSPSETGTAGVLAITVMNPDGTISPPVNVIVTAGGPPPARRRSAGH